MFFLEWYKSLIDFGVVVCILLVYMKLICMLHPFFVGAVETKRKRRSSN